MFVKQKLPLGHPRCLIGHDLRKFCMDVNKFDGLVKCKVLPQEDYTFHYYHLI